jgi:hypothetical protein
MTLSELKSFQRGPHHTVLPSICLQFTPEPECECVTTHGLGNGLRRCIHCDRLLEEGEWARRRIARGVAKMIQDGLLEALADVTPGDEARAGEEIEAERWDGLS